MPFRETIAIDADDTLFDENTAIRLFTNETFGFEHTAEDYSVTGDFVGYWERIWQLSPDVATEHYRNFLNTAKSNLEPMPGAREALESLKEHYDLAIVTMRDYHAVEMTQQAVAKHFPGLFRDIHFVPLWGGSKRATKAIICKQIQAGYLIDDGFEHCRLAAEASVEGLLFGDMGWSQTQALQPHMERIANWDLVKGYFDARRG